MLIELMSLGTKRLAMFCLVKSVPGAAWKIISSDTRESLSEINAGISICGQGLHQTKRTCSSRTKNRDSVLPLFALGVAEARAPLDENIDLGEASGRFAKTPKLYRFLP